MKKNTDLNQRAGQRIRVIRNVLGLSQSNLGERLDISYQQVQKYEAGVNNISLRRLDEIAAALGVPFDTLINDEHKIEAFHGTSLKAELLAVLQNLNSSRDTTLIQNDTSEEEIRSLIKEFSEIEDKQLRKSLYQLIKLLGG